MFQTSGVLKPNIAATPGTVGYVTNNYAITNGSQVAPVNKWSLKGDHIFSDKHRISGYYGNDREKLIPGAEGPATLPGLYTNYNDLTQYSDVFRMSWDWTMSATKFNHFYAGGNNWRQNHNPPQEYIGNWKDKFCLGGVPDCNENLVNFDFSNGYASWGGRANNGSENTIYSFNDDFTWIKGSHTFKLGGQYQLSHYNGFGRQCISGCATFSYTETGVPGGTNSERGRQPLRLAAARLRGHRVHRHHPLHRPAMALFRRLLSGRLARESEADCEPGPALGDPASTHGPAGPLERFLADHAESGRRQYSRAR